MRDTQVGGRVGEIEPKNAQDNAPGSVPSEIRFFRATTHPRKAFEEHTRPLLEELFPQDYGSAEEAVIAMGNSLPEQCMEGFYEKSAPKILGQLRGRNDAVESLRTISGRSVSLVGRIEGHLADLYKSDFYGELMPRLLDMRPDASSIGDFLNTINGAFDRTAPRLRSTVTNCFMGALELSGGDGDKFRRALNLLLDASESMDEYNQKEFHYRCKPGGTRNVISPLMRVADPGAMLAKVVEVGNKINERHRKSYYAASYESQDVPCGGVLDTLDELSRFQNQEGVWDALVSLGESVPGFLRMGWFRTRASRVLRVMRGRGVENPLPLLADRFRLAEVVGDECPELCRETVPFEERTRRIAEAQEALRNGGECGPQLHWNSGLESNWDGLKDLINANNGAVGLIVHRGFASTLRHHALRVSETLLSGLERRAVRTGLKSQEGRMRDEYRRHIGRLQGFFRHSTYPVIAMDYPLEDLHAHPYSAFIRIDRHPEMSDGAFGHDTLTPKSPIVHLKGNPTPKIWAKDGKKAWETFADALRNLGVTRIVLGGENTYLHDVEYGLEGVYERGCVGDTYANLIGDFDVVMAPGLCFPEPVLQYTRYESAATALERNDRNRESVSIGTPGVEMTEMRIGRKDMERASLIGLEIYPTLDETACMTAEGFERNFEPIPKKEVDKWRERGRILVETRSGIYGLKAF